MYEKIETLYAKVHCHNKNETIVDVFRKAYKIAKWSQLFFAFESEVNLLLYGVDTSRKRLPKTISSYLYPDDRHYGEGCAEEFTYVMCESTTKTQSSSLNLHIGYFS